MRIYIKRTERSEINDLMLQLKLLEKQNKQSAKQQKVRNKKRAKINETVTRKTIQIINETKSWFFEKKTRLTDSWQI
jgi:hypothetical protein